MSGALNPIPSLRARSSLLPISRLPRLPRRILLLAFALAAVLYVSFGSHASSLGQPLLDLRPRLPTTVRWGRPALANKPEEALVSREDGTVAVRRTGVGEAAEHPIRQLVREARREWTEQLERQSTTFAQAVATYRRRYGRAPPKGFNEWWAFVKEHGVQIVDDYDEINNSIAPFFALPPDILSERLYKVLYEEDFSFRMAIRRSQPVVTEGERAKNARPRLLAELVEGFRHFLPLDFGEGEGVLGEVGGRGNEGVVVWGGTDHDLGGHIMSQEYRGRMLDLASRGETIDERELERLEDRQRAGSLPGLINACEKDSPAGQTSKDLNDIILAPESVDDVKRRSKPVTFLKDVVKSYDFCNNPSLLPIHVTFSFDFPRDPVLLPQLVLSKYAKGNQILTAPLEAFDNKTQRLPWADKTVEKVFWRGSSTGDSFSNRTNYDWHQSHRIRLHTLTNSQVGHANVLVEVPLAHGEGTQLRLKRYELGELNVRLMDVGLSNINQCRESDGTCDRMRAELKVAERVNPFNAMKYKYALDVDGNGWSSRFRRLLASGNVVFKSTIFPEWNTQWLKPWVHYVPVNIDYSDLYHISTFFMGTPDGLNGNDDLAREISEAATEFVDKNWRWVDMQAYIFRLLLEYRRVMSTDRNAMSMDGHMW